MPIKYVGKTTYQVGKTLWEIVGNLQNFGVGRIVVRSTFERYSEPSYMKIMKVEAVPNEDLRRVNVWVEKVFRGRKFPTQVKIFGASYKPDYKLLSKNEEEAYCRYVPVEKEAKVLPRMAPLPPLLREFIIRDMKNRGQQIVEPQMEMQYRQGDVNMAKVATDDITPTVKIEPGLGKPASPKLYEGLLN